jgi:hypothetical protein
MSNNPKSPKPWYKSKTIWLNGLTAVIATLVTLGDQSIISDSPTASGVVLGALSVLNVALRIVTVAPIGNE